MTYKIERKRLRNSTSDQSYCLTIVLQDGIKIQVPASNPQEALEQYQQFNLTGCSTRKLYNQVKSVPLLFSALRIWK